MSDQATACPLAWPSEWPRTPSGHRAEYGGPFRQNRRWITINQAIGRVFEQCRKFGVLEDDVIISTNLKVRRADGLPRSDQRKPEDPGAAVYFPNPWSGTPQVVAVDCFGDIAQNIAACAATIEHLRGLERYGSAILEKAFTGFNALPSPENSIASDPPWRMVLCVGDETDAEKIEKAYKLLRSQEHPDKGGDAERFGRINRAWDAAKQELGL